MLINTETNSNTEMVKNTDLENNTELTWSDILKPEKEKPYFKDLMRMLNEFYKSGVTIYPKKDEIFNALKFTSFKDLKVVILGQDPYHGPNQAHGLSFSVRDNIPFPPSLRNIFLELNDDLNLHTPKSGNLERWSKQGVLLLNSVLTVEKSKAASHAGKGWEIFTDSIIKEISSIKEGVIFILWGAYAKKKGLLVDTTKHFILESAHPSPFSAHNGFFGCKHFSKTNEILEKIGKAPINWDFHL